MRGPRRKKAPRPEGQARGKSRAVCLGGQNSRRATSLTLPRVEPRANRQKCGATSCPLRSPGLSAGGNNQHAGSKSRSWQVRLVQGSTSSVIKRGPRLATDDGTKGAPNNLSTAVFGRRNSTVSVMARKINRVDSPRRSGRPDKRKSGGAAREELPEAPNAERTADDQVMLDQGLRLNRAFISINDSLVREAIVNLVVEAAMSPPSDALRRVRSSTSLREAPTRRRPRM